MQILMILALVILALLLLSLIRIGGIVHYSADGLTVRLRLGALHFTAFPLKKKKKKDKPPKPQKAPVKKPEQPPAQTGGSLELVRQFLPLAADAAGRFKRKIRIDTLDIDLIMAASDPAMAALSFGGVNAALGMMIPLFENNFKVKERRVRTSVDFNRTKPAIVLTAAFSLTIGQGVVLGCRLGVQALRIVLQHRNGQKQKEAV